MLPSRYTQAVMAGESKILKCHINSPKNPAMQIFLGAATESQYVTK